MKQDKHRFLRKRPGRKPGKAGSSLALVMMIGAALVIWVMCIMPLMTTTGTTAIQTEEKYDDYLESRSSIEYCKSELEKIVSIDKKVPRTFAVVRNDSTDTYSAVYKLDDSNFSNPPYSAIIQTDYVSPDTDDKPLSGDAGKNVTAICAVEWVNAENHYKITIQTYHNGEKGQTYSLIYTLSGSLLIYPESYDSGDALPLSDFVVVDGKMGANQIWNSTITMGTATSGGFSETLRAMKKDPEEEYASSLEYPAVFKKTAQAAPAGDADFLDPIKEDPVNTEQWREPTPVKANKTPKETGDIWVTVDSDNNIKVHVQTTTDTLVDNCKIYINGEKKDTVPGTGTYCVTVDYYGTNNGTYVEGGTNILPASGLRMLDTVGDTDFEKKASVTSSITNVAERNGKCTVTLANTGYDDVLYGYCTDPDATSCKWSDKPQISDLDRSKTYYFYVCRKAGFEDGEYKKDSAVKYVGMITPMATTLEAGEDYLMLGLYESYLSDNTYYCLSNESFSTNESLKANQLNVNVSGNYAILNSGSSLSGTQWKAIEAGSNKWKFNHQVDDGDSYLLMSGTYNKWDWPQWSMSLKTVSEFNDASSFSVDLAQGKVQTGISSNGKNSIGSLYLGRSRKIGSWAYSYYYKASSDNSAHIYFLKFPASAPAATKIAPPTPTDYSLGENNKFTFGEWNLLDFVKNYCNADFKSVYANDKKNPGSLPAGVYYLTTDITVDGIQYCVQLGDLTVNQAGMPTTLGIECSISGTDEKKVSITGTGWDAENGGTRWYGYREVAAEGEKPFHWFPAEEGAEFFALRLEYGAYEFAVRDCGSSNYNSIQSGSFPVTIKMNEVTLEENQNIQFLIDSDLVTWYKLPVAKLKENPEQTIQILPSRVHLIYGIGEEGGTNITWSENNDEKVNFYGVIVDGSNYCKDPDGTLHVLGPIPTPVKTTHEGGGTSSMMRGRSLYFMGEWNSINTLGNDVFLTTDLLVLKNDITGGGRVIVDPYSTSEILFMSVNGTSTFTAKTVYKLKSGIDLCNPDGQYEAIGSITDSDVRRSLFQEYPDYPDLNLDIAYANEQQLAHIVSGETIEWTNGGKLSGSKTDSNGSYVVCAYVTDMEGPVSYKASRVLIAGKDNTLNVGANLTFTTRYLSIDADQVVQGANNVQFVIKNLGQDKNWLSAIGEWADITKYFSRTLQVDYEKDNTKIIYADNSVFNVPKQICRYNDGDNLFGAAKPQELIVSYGANEIYNWFREDKVWGVYKTSTVKTVDRYITLTGGGSSAIDLNTYLYPKLKIYANYIYVDSSIDEIKLAYEEHNYIDDFSGDLLINSQEKGYSDTEYLGLFTDNSSDSYKGTLIYFAKAVTVYRDDLPGGKATINPGFYHIPPTSGGTSITALVNATPLTPAELKDMSVIIKPDGSFSNTGIDTGIFDNTSSGLGGFSGGNVG